MQRDDKRLDEGQEDLDDDADERVGGERVGGERVGGERVEEERVGSDLDADLDPERWYGEPNVCGSCIAWRQDLRRDDDTVATGVCRLRPELGRVPASLKKCEQYKPRGQFVYKPTPSARSGRRQSPVTARRPRGLEDRASPNSQGGIGDRDSRGSGHRGAGGTLYSIRDTTRDAVREVPRTVPREVDLGGDESVAVVRRALEELIRQELGRSRRELTPKYKGGVVRAKSEDGSMIEHDTARVFSMLDRLRSALDALEGAIQAKLPADEREEWIALVRRMHGSFTTFNVMFSHSEDHFRSK